MLAGHIKVQTLSPFPQFWDYGLGLFVWTLWTFLTSQIRYKPRNLFCLRLLFDLLVFEPSLYSGITFDLPLFDLHVIRISHFDECYANWRRKNVYLTDQWDASAVISRNPWIRIWLAHSGSSSSERKCEDRGDSDLWGRYTRVRVRRPPRRPRQYIWWTY